MLFLLSPAKTLDYETPLPRGVSRRVTQPDFIDQAAGLIEPLARLTPPQVADLMHLSDALAALNVGRYAAWTPQHDARNSRPAVFAFNGDVYDGLDVRTLGSADLGWLQQHVVILSGLYGALRPFDALQPYRLEMGTTLANARGKDLYAYWGDGVAQWLNRRLEGERQPLVVNLASQEYSRVVDRKALAARIVDCRFEDWKDGHYKVISFFAKRARGALARWAVQQRARSLKALHGFDADGYAFVPEQSSEDLLLFRRRASA